MAITNVTFREIRDLPRWDAINPWIRKWDAYAKVNGFKTRVGSIVQKDASGFYYAEVEIEIFCFRHDQNFIERRILNLEPLRKPSKSLQEGPPHLLRKLPSKHLYIKDAKRAIKRLEELEI